MLISDIFKTVGQPTITYIERDSGKFDRALDSSISESGQICLITGPSKTGKTTLYRKVLGDRGEVPLIVRCDGKIKCEDIWRRALEAVDFERVQSRTVSKGRRGELEGSGEGVIGWKWLAGISAKIRASISTDSSEDENRERILSSPGPDLLVPILRETNYVLVIEDFHYMDDIEKTILFQQWKRFVDGEVSVIVLGTTHRAVDIANSNKDLIGRVRQIDVSQWDHRDLEEIARRGFEFLGISPSRGVLQLIANEAVGLPIIVQQACLQILEEKGIRRSSDIFGKKIKIGKVDTEAALHIVATTKYTQFRSYYDTLIKGPREKARKYRTYELVIGCFTLDPIKFSLSRKEIDQRVPQLCLPEDIPPAASMNSTFGALKKFQERRQFELLEWLPNEEVLYIIEPSFLFYVRWRRVKSSSPVQLDFIELLIRKDWIVDLDKLQMKMKSVSDSR